MRTHMCTCSDRTNVMIMTLHALCKCTNDTSLTVPPKDICCGWLQIQIQIFFLPANTCACRVLNLWQQKQWKSDDYVVSELMQKITCTRGTEGESSRLTLTMFFSFFFCLILVSLVPIQQKRWLHLHLFACQSGWRWLLWANWLAHPSGDGFIAMGTIQAK